MNYVNEQNVHLMYGNRGDIKVSFNVKKNIVLEKGDTITLRDKKIIQVFEILDSRQSSMNNFNYVTILLSEKL